MKLCWVDKLAVTWAAMIFFTLFLLASDRSGMVGDLLGSMGLWLLAYLVFPPWAILRLVRWSVSSARVAR